MANPDTPGTETSEHDAMKKAQVWIRFAAAVIAAAATALLATGVIPPESAWVGILTMLGALAATVGGEVATAKNYTMSRTAIKAAKVAGQPGNPTQP